VRDETLVLRTRHGDRQLGTHRVTGYDNLEPLATQRRFQVSPDARALAFALPNAAVPWFEPSEVRILRRDGLEITVPSALGEMRFSPDGRALALVVSEPQRPSRIDRVDVRSLERAPWAELPGPTQLEFCGEGLVVLHRGPLGALTSLTLLPWTGAPRQLDVPGSIERFVCAKAGRRLVAFTREGVFSSDVGDGGAGGSPAVRLAQASWSSTVANAEMSPDGQRVLFATHEGLWSIEGSAAPTIVSADPDVHTLWFSRDGASWAFATRARAEHRTSETRALVARDGDLRAMRFIPAGVGLLVSRGREVVRWSHGREEVLATVDDDRLLLGADLFAGGLLLWLGTPWERFGPGRP
jgi:hypothetical protein